jgi:hypothetical protein
MSIPTKKNAPHKHVFEIDPNPASQSLQGAMEMHQMMAKAFWSMTEKNLEYMSEAMQAFCDNSSLKNLPGHELCENWFKELRSAQDASLKSMHELMDGYYKAVDGMNVDKGKK